MTDIYDDDAARDAHLRAALRHAPDAGLAPPPALSAAILREARSAAAPVARPPVGRRLWGAVARLWAALGRPAVAAGFASVMVASVVGVMWWDRSSDRPFDSTGAPVAADAAAPNAAAAASATTAPTVPGQTAGPASGEAVEAKAEAALSERRAAPAAERRAEPAARQRERAAARQAAAPLPKPPLAGTAPAPPLAAAAPAPPTAADAAAATQPALLPPALAAAPMAAAPAAKPADALRSSARFAPAPGPATLVELADRIAAEPQRWAWRRRADAAQAMNGAVQGWLAAAAREGSTASVAPKGSQAIARDRGPAALALGESATGDAAASDGAELQLLLDGQLQHTLRVDATALRWRSSGAPSAEQRLPLAPATAATLRAALDAAAP